MNYQITTFNSAPMRVLLKFEAWVKSLTVELDNEQGDGPGGTWEWVIENNVVFTKAGPHATFIFFNEEDGEIQIVGTSTFTPDDRGALLNNQIFGALGVWGFIEVRRDLRKQGLGREIKELLDNHIQQWVSAQRSPGDVYLFTDNPESYQRYGFKRTDKTVKFLGRDEVLLIKHYSVA